MRFSEITQPKEDAAGLPGTFQKWFSGSHVVDADGKPERVYHGTTASFDQFRTFSRGPKLADGLGAHFGTVKAAADRVRKNVGRDAEGANIMPVYLSVRHPLLSRSGDVMSETQLQAYLSRIASKLGIPKDRHRAYSYGRSVDAAITKAVKDELIRRGYDGIPYRNSHEDRGSVSWIAFHPHQIKSAIGNKGSWDATSSVVTEETSIRDSRWKTIPFDDLPVAVRQDIASWIVEHHPYFEHEHSAEFVHANLFGLTNPPLVRIGMMPVASLSGREAISNSVVERYAAMLRSNPTFDFDPVLVEHGRFLDGGHRVAAYRLAGRQMIPVVEIGHMTGASTEAWEDWMDGHLDARFEPDDAQD